jgi:hypothetical protein
MVARQSRSKSKPRCGRHRLVLAGAFLLEQFGDQEGHVDRLFGIETGIADRVIAVVEVLVGDGAGADALVTSCPVISGGRHGMRTFNGRMASDFTSARSNGRVADRGEVMVLPTGSQDRIRRPSRCTARISGTDGRDLIRPKRLRQRQIQGVRIGDIVFEMSGRRGCIR